MKVKELIELIDQLMLDRRGLSEKSELIHLLESSDNDNDNDKS